MEFNPTPEQRAKSSVTDIAMKTAMPGLLGTSLETYIP